MSCWARCLHSTWDSLKRSLKMPPYACTGRGWFGTGLRYVDYSKMVFSFVNSYRIRGILHLIQDVTSPGFARELIPGQELLGNGEKFLGKLLERGGIRPEGRHRKAPLCLRA